MLTEGRGIPLGVVVTGANRTDMKKLGALLDATLIAIPQQARKDAADTDEAMRHLCLDRGYDYPVCRAEAEAHGYVPHIPKRGAKRTRCPRPPIRCAIRRDGG